MIVNIKKLKEQNLLIKMENERLRKLLEQMRMTAADILYIKNNLQTNKPQKSTDHNS